MSKRNVELLLEDIIESGNKILSYTALMSYEDFIHDSKTLDAVIRNFAIIGEAANRLPEEFRNVHPEIDWNRLRGMRNRIIHDYAGIDYSIVWQIKCSFLQDMMKKLETLQL